jgi:hypothetical protein
VCGARRTPFAANIINLTGRPARVGGAAARVFGWTALLVGLFLALTVGLIVQALAAMVVATTWIGWAVGIPIALLSLIVGMLGILGGRRLGAAGKAKLELAQLDTIRGLARHQGGVVKPADLARALGVGEAEADGMLAQLAKHPDENVSVDVDDEGSILYLFDSAEAIRWRVRAEAAGIGPAEREALEAELERAEEQTEREQAERRSHARRRQPS